MKGKLYLSACSVAALLAQVPAPGPTVRVPVRLVTVPTLVFSKNGHLVPGLEKTDFRVFDNDRLQNPALDMASAPVSVAVVVQVNQEVRSYLPFIAKTGSVLDALFAGESGETAVVAYDDEVRVLKPFEQGDVHSALERIAASGREAHMIDAGLQAVSLLKTRPESNARVVLFIGQPMDRGSQSNLAILREQVERETVSVYALTLPEFGRAFVSDTFSLGGLPQDRGGIKAGVNLGNLIGTANRSTAAQKGADPFSVLTAATGGTQMHFRKQHELEDAISLVGVELRSAYVLSYAPGSRESGYHTIRVEVDVPGATICARPGYWRSDN